MIKEFSREVIERLNYYVYRLVDPFTGQTFYVGKGRGNRLFDHINNFDNFYQSYKENVTEDNKDPAKIEMIRSIRNRGLDVIHIIQRWGMDNDTAMEVESSLIDLFGLENLTNKIKGKDNDRGLTWADDIEKRLNAKDFDEDNAPCNFFLVKINDYHINNNGGLNEEGFYNTAKGDWTASLRQVKKYSYVLASRYGIVVGVYKVIDNGWKQTPSGRVCFEGIKAEKEIFDYFINKRIPARFRKRGSSLPFMYSHYLLNRK